MSAVESISVARILFLNFFFFGCMTWRIALRVSAGDVLGGGPGVHGGQEQQLAQEVLRRGQSGQRQPPEVLLHPGV